jgi:hypothetical protein
MRIHQKMTVPARESLHPEKNEPAESLKDSLNESVKDSVDSFDPMLQSEGQFQVYRELSDYPVSQMDPWLEMQANLETLCELQQRLSFTVREIRYLLKA